MEGKKITSHSVNEQMHYTNNSSWRDKKESGKSLKRKKCVFIFMEADSLFSQSSKQAIQVNKSKSASK